MKIFDEILRQELFQERPPVLVDIGAATELCGKWAAIAPYSVCIAFDPDSRQTDYIEAENSKFRKLYFFPRLVHAEVNGEIDFYLTASPECSSSLEPDRERLADWYLAPFFEVEKKVKMPAMTMPEVLKTLKLDYIDALKCDTQGTDVRIFRSLGDRVIRELLSVELEPGIIDAYRGEDKLWMMIREMDATGLFWMSDCRIQHTQYLPVEVRRKYFSPLRQRLVPTCFPGTPGWGEVAWLNRLRGAALTPRSVRLGWIMAMSERQYGFALELADRGLRELDDPFCEELAAAALKAVPFWGPVLRKILRKVIGK